MTDWHGWRKRKVSIRHEGGHHHYEATLHHPPKAIWRIIGIPLSKAIENLQPGGRWITVHPNGKEEKGHAVYIVPHPDGSYVIAGGAGDALNGLRLTGVKSPEEYKAMAKDAAEKNRTAAIQREAKLRQEMSPKEYQEFKKQQKAAASSANEHKREAQEAFVQQVAEAQGVAPESLQPDPQVVEDLKKSNPRAAQKYIAKNHRENVAWAKGVVQQTRKLVAVEYARATSDALGEVPLEDLADRTGSGGIGYRTDTATLAAENGLTDEKRDRITEGLKRAAREGREKAPPVPQDAEAAEQREAAVHPRVESLEAATALIAADRKLQHATRSAQEAKSALAKAQRLTDIPRAALIPQGEDPTEEELNALVEKAMGSDSRTHAITTLVDTLHQLDRHGNSLAEHASVGTSGAFNEVSLLVDQTAIDPLVSDTLGAQGTARALVEHWRATLDPEAFDGLKSKLLEHHLATQVETATKGFDEAERLMGAAESIPEPYEHQDHTIEAGLAAHAERAELYNRAAEAAGVAAGRLEAFAALNEAFMEKPSAGVLTRLGKMTPDQAADAAFAAGLQEGGFELHQDGKQMLLEIKPDGLKDLFGETPTAVQHRAEITADIKNGAMDEESWLPKGFANRPRSTVETDPLEFDKQEFHLDISNGADQKDIEQSVRDYIGARIQDGHDPDDIRHDLFAATFRTGLNLDTETGNRYSAAIQEVAGLRGQPRGETVEEYKAWKEKQTARMWGYGDDYLKGMQLSPEDATLESQRISSDDAAAEAAYTSVIEDPRTLVAFKKLGAAWQPHERRALREYFFEHIAHIEPDDDAPTEILSEGEHRALAEWKKLQATGDPYGAIQKQWRANQEEENANQVSMFGDTPEPHAFSTCDLSSDVSVIAAAKALPALLGYQYTYGADGKKTYEELTPGTTYESMKGIGQQRKIVTSLRTEEDIAKDARARIQDHLKNYCIARMANAPDAANSHFDPENIETASDAWTAYVKAMGGINRATSAVQEFMKGDLVKKFAPRYEAITGRKLQAVERAIPNSNQHAKAMLGPEHRRTIARERRSLQATLQKDRRGRFTAGAVAEKIHLNELQQHENPNLMQAEERQVTTTQVRRATIGKAAESTLAQLLPNIDITKPTTAATDVTMSGKAIARQRAIKLIKETKRLILAASAGSGKTSVLLGAFSDLHAEGKAKKALLCVPSAVVGQFGTEMFRFLDPKSGLRWHADSSATADERKAAYADPGKHLVAVTPEALRQDITEAVAEDLRKSPEETVQHLADLSDDERDKVIHGAMDKRGWNFDFQGFDESHRLLDRQGKPDAHMARIGASIARAANYYVASSADPVKNDSTEAQSALSRIDPKRYNDQTKPAFLRRYNRNTLATARSLRREMEPYMYASNMDLGCPDPSRRIPPREEMKLTPQQQQENDRIESAYASARAARIRGTVDRDALKVLSPGSFEAGEPDEETLARLNTSLGALHNSAVNRVVNAHPEGVKVNWTHRYIQQHKGEPIVVFAHSLDALAALKTRLKKEGQEFAMITGDEDGKAKAKSQGAFQTGKVDVLLCSDAGEAGLNLQRGRHLINMDVPLTSKTHEQRIAREHRIGQTAQVQVHDLVSDTDFDRRARKRLEEKHALREVLTSNSELIDDSGLATRITQGIAKRFQRAYRKAA